MQTGQRLKYFYRVVDRRAGRDQPPLLAVSIHHGVVPRYQITDDLPRAEDLSNYKLCEPGDIVLNRMRAFQGAIGLSRSRGLVSPDYLVLRPERTVESRYLHHLFRSSWFISEMSSRLRGIGGTESGSVRTPRINSEDLGEIKVSLHSLVEQRRIADFLDAETARIDCLDQALQESIGLLRQRRVRVIDTGLSRTAGRKVRLKYLASLVDTEHKTAPHVPGGGFWVAGTSSIREGEVNIGALYETDMASYQEWTRRKRPSPGDLLLSREAPVGEVAIYRSSDPPIAIGQRMVLISPQPTLVRSEYLMWFLLSSSAQQFFKLTTQGSLHPHLNMRDIGSIPVKWCDLSRQDRVLASVAKEHELTRGLIAARTKMRVLLSERRQALITAAVTGQFDVSTASGRGVTE